MIHGIGCDVVDINRFAKTLERTPALAARLFTTAERSLPVRSQAARFAAKEAAIKALGGSTLSSSKGQYDLQWHDLEVLPSRGARPRFSTTPGLFTALQIAGVQELHLSLSHDTNTALAYVIATQRQEEK